MTVAVPLPGAAHHRQQEGAGPPLTTGVGLPHTIEIVGVAALPHVGTGAGIAAHLGRTVPQEGTVGALQGRSRRQDATAAHHHVAGSQNHLSVMPADLDLHAGIKQRLLGIKER